MGGPGLGRTVQSSRSRAYKGYSSIGSVELFDDFLGDLIEDGWTVAADTGGSVNCGTAAESGVVTLTTDGTDDDVVSVAHELNWYGRRGCMMEARVKWDVVTTLGFFIGFSDAKSEAGSTMPAALSGTSYTTTATDALGFLFDTDATTDTIRCIGVANDVDATHVDSALSPSAGVYATFRVHVTSAGVATFYIDDVLVGTVAGAVTSTVALTPYVGHKNMSAAAHVGSLDYIYCAQSRT